MSIGNRNRQGHSGFQLPLLLALVPLHSAVDTQCKNPLFQAHWFGPPGLATGGSTNPQTLLSIPAVETDLKYCPFYNGKASCCNLGFELAQIEYFSFFRHVILPSLVQRIADHHDSVADVQHTSSFSAAAREEKQSLGLALERFDAVLSPTVQGPCFQQLLAYQAGMECFACRPYWSQYVTIKLNKVIRVHVDPTVCMKMWMACEAFGNAAADLREALLDSLLAKQAKMPYVDLSMFSDQQALCDWLHDRVALHPFERPTETELETAPQSELAAKPVSTTPGVISTTAPAFGVAVAPGGEGPTDPIGATAQAQTFHQMNGRRLDTGDPPSIGESEIDVLSEGARSGFDMSWVKPSSRAYRSVLSINHMLITSFVGMAFVL